MFSRSTRPSNFIFIVLLSFSLVCCKNEHQEAISPPARVDSVFADSNPSSQGPRVLITPLLQTPCLRGLVSGIGISPLRVVFLGVSLPTSNIGQVVKTGVNITPAMEGEWRWASTNELAFFPKTDWTAKTNYRVVFSQELFPKRSILRKNVGGCSVSVRMTPSTNAGDSDYCFTPYNECFNRSSVRFPYTLTAPAIPNISESKVPDPLVLSFESAVGRESDVNKALEDGANITPKISGSWVWTSRSILAFKPSEPWKSNTQYTVVLTDSAFAADAIIPGYEYTFSTPMSGVEAARQQVTLSGFGGLALESDPKPQALQIVFQTDVVGPSRIDREVISGAQLTPRIEGNWRWTSGNTLAFTPKSHWPGGVSYALMLDGAAFGDKPEAHTASFKFSSPNILLNLEQPQLYTDPTKSNVKVVTATVRSSHPLNRTDFEHHISIRFAAKPTASQSTQPFSKQLNFAVTYDQFDHTAYIRTEPIQIPVQDSEVVVSISSGVHSSIPESGISNSQKMTVYVPSIDNYFRISDISFQQVLNRQHNEDQVLVLTSTAALAPITKDQITAYLLPEYFPGTERDQARTAYEWDNPAEVTPQILSSSEKVALEPIPNEVALATTANFSFRAPSLRYLFVRVAQGIESVDGYKLVRAFDQTVFVGAAKKTIKLLANGSLLSLAGEKKLSVLVRGVPKIEIEIARVLPATVHSLVSQTYGDFQHPFFNNYQFTMDDIAERFTEVREFPNDGIGTAHYTAIDFGALLNSKLKVPRGLFWLKVTELGNAPTETASAEGEEYDSSENERVSETRLILVTDLGIVAKTNQAGTQDVFVQNLSTGLPAGGVVVRVIGRNGLALFDQTTDAGGHVSLPSLNTLTREKEPQVYTAELNGDLTFMPFRRQDRHLNLSRFDVGGLQTQADAPGVQSFLFTDRKVYRPGDEIHFGIVTKPDDWSQDLRGMPLEAVLIDPRGSEIRKEKLKLSAAGFEEISHRTDEASPTGNYELALYVVKDEKRSSRLGSTTARVEEFLPDRMRIRVQLRGLVHSGWVSPVDLAAEVSLQNLFGTPAQDRRLIGRLQLQPAGFSFPEFKDYFFSDPFQGKNSFDEELPNQVSDKEGRAEFKLGLDRFTRATYRLNVLASGFEMEGGRSVSAVASAIVSPLTSLVGFKPDGDFSYIAQKNEASVNLIAVNSDLQRIALRNLKADLIELRWVSVLTKQQNETYAYQSVMKEIPVASSPLEINVSDTAYQLDTSKPGNFAVVVRDAEGLELNRIRYSVFGAGEVSANLEANAELEVKLDRSDYTSGDDIAVSIRAPYSGAGLITIEKNKVYGYTWFKSSSRSSVQHIKVPEALEGNGYVTVTFVRALDSKEIYLTPLSYGVAPFSIDRERRRAKVELQAPSEVKPGMDLAIKYRGTNFREGTGKAAIYLVDEGILQFARYQTPDPLAYFFRKRALEVGTVQVLDLLLPEYSLVRELSGIGGDEDLMGKHLNPFKRKRSAPVVAWSGIVDIGAEDREFNYKVPEYFNGSIRIMAVAVSANSVGSAEIRTTVRGDFVISPNVPAAVSPGDQFEVSASVSNGLQVSSDVTVSLLPGPGLEIVGSNTVTKTINRGDETAVVFEAKARPVLGVQTLRFEARGGKDGASAVGITEEVSVRPSSPLRNTVQAGVLDLSSESPSKKIEITRRDVYPYGAKLDGSVSPLPFGFTAGFQAFLESYPYGCTEQLSSRAIAAFIMLDYPAVGQGRGGDGKGGKRKEVQRFLNTVIHTLRTRQGSDGGIAMWKAGSYVSEVAHLYATLMLMEAKDRGVAVPGDMLKDALRYAEDLSTRSKENSYAAAFAAYLVARSGKPAMGAVTALRGWLENRQSGSYAQSQRNWKRELPGMFLAATYKLLQADKEAYALYSNASPTEPVVANYEYYYDGFVHGSIYFYLAARHFPDSLKKLPPNAIKNYLKPAMVGGGVSTHSASWAILALDAYVHTLTSKDQPRFSVELLDQSEVVTAISLTDPLYPSFGIPLTAKSLRIVGEQPMYYQLYQEGFDILALKDTVSNQLEVDRRVQNEAGQDIAELKLGEKAVVVLRVHAKTQTSIRNVVIVDMLPGGFDVVMTESRLEQGGNGGVDNWGFGLPESDFIPDYADVREDRVLLFGTVPSDRTVEFRYRLSPTNRGTFAVPPVYAESMYDRSLNAIAPGRPVNLVVKGE